MATEKKIVAESKTINTLIYGAPGIGKTHFASTAPKPYIIDMEDGGLTIDQNTFPGKINLCLTIAEIQAAISEALKEGYKTIVFDTLTRYCEILLDRILEEGNKTKAGWDEYGEVSKRIRKLVWSLRFKKVNMIFLCHEKEIESENGLIKRLALQSSLTRSIPAIMDVVGYLHKNNKDERAISVNPTPFWDAKHRIPIQFSIKESLPNDFNALYTRMMYRGE